MVKLALVKSSNAELVSQPLVAVFVGGTSGIGKNTIITLAETHGTTGKGLRAYIIGRNAKAAESIIAECQKHCPTGQFLFQQVTDLALMKDCDKACAELVKTEEKEAAAKGETARIDILVLSASNFTPFDPRNETEEGLDRFMSFLHYSRARITTLLLPLLLSSTLPAHIISVFGPDRSQTFIPSDLSLRSPKNYGFMPAGSHAAYFKTFFFEHLAAKYPGKLALVHYFPGLVYGETFESAALPWWLKAIFRYGGPIIRRMPGSISREENGERTLFNATKRFPARGGEGKGEQGAGGAIGIAESSDGVVGGGAYRVHWDGELVDGKQYKKMRDEGWPEKILQHTWKAWEDIETKGKFTD